MTEPIQLIPCSSIDLSDLSLQMRASGIDWDFVETLSDLISDGVSLAPVDLYADGEKYFLGDGWHRCYAYHSANKPVRAIVRAGGRAAALHYALSANADQQAKPRTRKDIRKAVITAINTYMLGKDAAKNIESIFPGQKKPATQVQIAEMCRTTQNTVSLILKAIKQKEHANAIANGDIPSPSRQIDFWERIKLDTIEVASAVRSLINDRVKWKIMEQDPEKAAEHLEYTADALAQEVRAIKQAARDIRAGIKASK